jgi:hypothetical protein
MDDYVLVELRILGRMQFYIDIVTKVRDIDHEYDVVSSHRPQVEDMAAVSESQIKIILPQLDSCGQTKMHKGRTCIIWN